MSINPEYAEFQQVLNAQTVEHLSMQLSAIGFTKTEGWANSHRWQRGNIVFKAYPSVGSGDPLGTWAVQSYIKQSHDTNKLFDTFRVAAPKSAPTPAAV